MNESLLKFFNLPGYNTNSANGKKDYFRQIKIDNVSNPKNYFINCDLIDKLALTYEESLMKKFITKIHILTCCAKFLRVMTLHI